MRTGRETAAGTRGAPGPSSSSTVPASRLCPRCPRSPRLAVLRPPKLFHNNNSPSNGVLSRGYRGPINNSSPPSTGPASGAAEKAKGRGQLGQGQGGGHTDPHYLPGPLAGWRPPLNRRTKHSPSLGRGWASLLENSGRFVLSQEVTLCPAPSKRHLRRRVLVLEPGCPGLNRTPAICHRGDLASLLNLGVTIELSH